MFKLITASLLRRLSFQFFLVASIPAIVTLLVVAYHARGSMKQQVQQHLVSINQLKRTHVVAYLNESRAFGRLLAASAELADATRKLLEYHDNGGAKARGSYDVASDTYEQLQAEVGPSIDEKVSVTGFRDALVICAAHGHVMYSSSKSRLLGSNLAAGPLKETGLTDLWRAVLQSRATELSDFSRLSPTDAPTAFLGTPLFNEHEALVAVAAFQLDTNVLNSILGERAGMGETGESYLVGEDQLMRTDSKLSNEPTLLVQKVASAGDRGAWHDANGIQFLTNYRGKKVISAMTDVGLNERLGTRFEWGIVSETEADEALNGINRVLLTRLWIGIALAGLACIAGYFSARSFARPISDLAKKATCVADGDLTVDIKDIDRDDEIGILSRAFREMMTTIREQVRRTTEGAEMLGSAISQISSTASQLAAGAAETSAAVSEISATVEEVRRTARLSSDEAAGVAKHADEAARISESGRAATEEAIHGMQRIKEEVERIAAGIIELSEQSQSIGEIINAVNDLADQSNLLSVNASIEAAKAGDHGRGFAVVAQEVKSLADQSKEATNQVRAILNDIQKATGTAVMATERGNKAVDGGVGLTGQAGETIRALVEKVVASADSATQIASTSQQQLTGLDQLVEAMGSIKEASIQNVDGARQLESAVRELEGLGDDMKDLAQRFTF